MRRSIPELAVFAIASLVLVVVVGIIVTQWLSTPTGPPVVDVRVAAVRQVADGSWQVEAVATNVGAQTAEQVEVIATLTLPDGVEERSQTVGFLSRGEQARLVFVFPVDPSTGRLEVQATSFGLP